MDVNEEYLKIFGVETRPSLYASDDSAYKALRQEILNAPREYNPLKELPFDDISLLSYDEYKNIRYTQEVEKNGYRVFYIKRQEDNQTSCYAAGYFVEKSDAFVVLRGARFKDTEYFRFLLSHIGDDLIKKLFLHSFKIENGHVYQTLDINYKSASLAASYILGKKSDYRTWIDDRGRMLDSYYSFYKSADVMEREERSFPDVQCLDNQHITPILSALKQRRQNIKQLYLFDKMDDVDSCRDQHLFFIKIDGLCDASGYYDSKKQQFIIKRGSSFNTKVSNRFNESMFGQMRNDFVHYKCSQKDSQSVVNSDALCKSAGVAATFLLGKISSFMSWKDSNGKSLRDVYPDSFSRKSSSPSDESTEMKNVANAMENNNQQIADIQHHENKEIEDNTHFFYIKKNFGENRICDATGYYDTITKKFIVKKDSYFTLDVTLSYKYTASWQSRQLFVNRMCKREAYGYKLKKDYIFDAPSMAATFVVGRNANGWNEWRDKDGKTLSDVINNPIS